MNTEKPKPLITPPESITPQELADGAEVQHRLAQPAPWLVEAAGPIHASRASTETAPAQAVTPAEMQRRDGIQKRLAERSPWLK